MPRLKRTRDDAELDLPSEPAIPAEHVETLTKLRNMWEFASFMQYIYLFGSVVKIDDDFDIEDLEAECLRPTPSERLAAIGLQLLKYVSSHRGLTAEIFDEYTRRQYEAKAPQRNPFGVEEEPAKFNEMDIYTRIQILHQLSTWTLWNTDRIRGLMPADEDHLNWRMEPLGWDSEDRAYFVLDDNRLYCRTDEVPPPPSPPRSKAKPKPKSKSKAKVEKKPYRNTRNSKATRSSKRLKLEDEEDEEEKDEPEDMDVDETAVDDTVLTNGDDLKAEDDEPGFGFTSKTWQCIAVTLEDYQNFLSTIFRSRDPNEKELKKRIEEDVLPIIEKRAESIRQKQLKKLRELENLQKMATAKRSGRLANKAEREKEERERQEAEEKRQRDIKMAREEEERQRRIEEGHESRRQTREQRLKEREAKRILHEEELARLQELEERADSQDPSVEGAGEGSKRISERQTLSKKEQHQKELELLAEEEGDWYFDCAKCGMHGENLDDGTHSVACDKCGVWQHSKCYGFSPKQAESEGFTFVCRTCKRKEEDAKRPKIPPLKLTRNPASASPESHQAPRPSPSVQIPKSNPLPPHLANQLDAPKEPQQGQQYPPIQFVPYGNGSQPQAQPQPHAPSTGYHYPPVSNFAQSPPQQPRRPSAGYASSPQPRAAPVANGFSPHQQQHQAVHHNAVSSSGAHPGYAQNGQGQPAPLSSGQAPSVGHAAPHYQPQPAQQGQWNQNQPHAPPPALPHQRPQHHESNGAAPANGPFSSPVKAQARPVLPSPGQQQASYPPQQPYRPPHSPNLAHSPHSSFPPPVHNQYHGGSGSPVKSSPPPRPVELPPPRQLFPQLPQARPSSQHEQRPAQSSPSFAHTTPRQTIPLPPPSSNGFQPFQTPEMRPVSSAGSAGGADIAADGMSGPWPDASKAIPQKKLDQSPAPMPPASSFSSQAGAENGGLPESLAPIRALAPSPRQPPTAENSIPVKKMVMGESSPIPPANMLPPIQGTPTASIERREPPAQ